MSVTLPDALLFPRKAFLAYRISGQRADSGDGDHKSESTVRFMEANHFWRERYISPVRYYPIEEAAAADPAARLSFVALSCRELPRMIVLG